MSDSQLLPTVNETRQPTCIKSKIKSSGSKIQSREALKRHITHSELDDDHKNEDGTFQDDCEDDEGEDHESEEEDDELEDMDEMPTTQTLRKEVRLFVHGLFVLLKFGAVRLYNYSKTALQSRMCTIPASMLQLTSVLSILKRPDARYSCISLIGIGQYYTELICI